MSKIKILHIIKSLGRGGAEMLLPETLKLHNREKFEFHYIYFLPWKDQMVEELKKSGSLVTCFPSANNISLLLQYGKVDSYCRSNNIDLIHCHLPWAGFLGRIIHYKTKIPVIYTEHNMQDRYHWVTKTLNKFTYNYQSLALGVSDDVSKSIKDQINPHIPVETLLNGVNTNKFRRDSSAGSQIKKKFAIPVDAIVIGNVAVFRFQKRLKEWLRVFKEVESENSNVYGIIVGFGPLENEIFEEVKALELTDKVFFPGLQEDVRPYFSAMDIFMMSSSFEGLPIALLEAMSMGCAGVSTNAGGIKEVVRDKIDGLICEVDKWKDLAEMCDLLIKDPVKLNVFKVAARQRVTSSFSLENMVYALEMKYENFVINQKK